MINQLRKWQGACEINGQYFDSFPVDFSDFSDMMHIKLYPCAQKREESTGNDEKVQSIKGSETLELGHTYEITVKQYMTRKSTLDFDFMYRFNADNPMPLRTMTGEVLKETKGMVYMKLKGKAQKTVTCMRCGRELTNPVSKLYGIGPECLHKIPVLFNSDMFDVDSINEKIQDVEWEGWVIRSAITKWEEV